MTNEQKEKIALFKYSIIAPLVANPGQFDSNADFFAEQSEKEWTHPNGRKGFISASTIERWYYTYKKHGFSSLAPKSRTDFGRSRKVDDDTLLVIKEIMNDYPRMNAKSIYKKLIEDQQFNSFYVSYDTINRVFKKLKKASPDNVKQMLRYECKFANDIWCADSTFGLYLHKNNSKIKLVIIAFIDDASRLITSCRIYDSDNIPSLLDAYKSAIEKYGKPRLLNVDNGSNYRSSSYSLVNAKLGVGIHYDPIHSPTSKSKIERFFRTLKVQWMSSIRFSDFHSIDDFQKSLDIFINKYNNTIHSSLNGLTPNERFHKDIESINFLDQELIDNAFLMEVSRKATFDSLVTINETFFQLPPKFSMKRVQLLYSANVDRVFVVDGDSKIEVFKLDKVANSSIQRSQYKLSSED